MRTVTARVPADTTDAAIGAQPPPGRPSATSLPADASDMDDDRVALDELADRLHDERRIVAFLLYKLAVSRLLLAADERGFAPAALREVDRAMELLHEGVLRRDEAGRKLVGLWRVSPEEWLKTTDGQSGPNSSDEAVERRQATLHALSQAVPPSLVSFLR